MSRKNKNFVLEPAPDFEFFFPTNFKGSIKRENIIFILKLPKIYLK